MRIQVLVSKKPFSDRELGPMILQHAEWYCLYGGGGIYNNVQREPEPCDIEAAELLKQLRRKIT